MSLSPLEIIKLFQISGEPSKSDRFGSGHINDTYKIIHADEDSPDYLLQRINDHVFKDVDGMMRNISSVTDHISIELKKQGFDDVDKRVLKLIRTTSGQTYAKVNDQYWRVYRFMEELKSYDIAESPQQVYQGGKAFGQFLRLLGYYPAETLSITIKDFHNVITRIDQFKSTLKASQNSKDPEVAGLTKFILSVASELNEIEKLYIQGKIPVRVTHNDTKFNNVLFDQNGQAMCIIDLDTVMPGIVHYDFGDGIRAGASTTIEDDNDLTKVDLDLTKFEAFAAGYLEMTRDLLLPIEVKYLAKSPALFSYLMALRFLTDYLNGNKYYKVNYPSHNLVRAKNQVKLTDMILKRIKELDQIIFKHTTIH